MVKNSRINESVKRDKQAFTLVNDLNKDDVSESDCANFEDLILSGDPVVEIDVYRDGSMSHVLDVISSLGDKDLITLGRLFVQNNFSFEGLQGLCGFDSQKFRDVKRRLVEGLRSYYDV